MAKKKVSPVKVTNVVRTKPEPYDDSKWQRESDARKLAEAEAIKSNKKRMKGAQLAAKEMLKEKEPELKELRRIAKTPYGRYAAKENKKDFGY